MAVVLFFVGIFGALGRGRTKVALVWFGAAALVLSLFFLIAAFFGGVDVGVGGPGIVLGWVFSKTDETSLRLGFTIDHFSVFASFCASFLGAWTFVMCWGSRPDRNVLARAGASIMIGVSGVLLTWAASTSWTHLLGWAVTCLAGIISAVDEKANRGEDRVSFRMATDGIFSLMLGVAGVSLIYIGNSLGVAILFLGAGWMMRLFPFSGGLYLEEKSELSTVQFLVCRVFPAWAALGMTFRTLSGGAVESDGGVAFWFVFTSSLLMTLSAAFAVNRSVKLNNVYSIWSAMAWLFLLTGDAVSMFFWLAGASFGTLALIHWDDHEVSIKTGTPAGPVSIKTVLLVILLVGGGAAPFLGAEAQVVFLSSFFQKEPAFALGESFLFLASQLVLWGVGLEYWRESETKQKTNLTLAAFFTLMVPCLLVLWSSELIPGFETGLFEKSALTHLSEGREAAQTDLSVGLGISQGLLALAIVLAISLGRWFSAWKNKRKNASPGMVAWLSEGLWVDRGAGKITSALVSWGGSWSGFIEGAVAREGVPKFASALILRFEALSNGLEKKVPASIRYTIERSVVSMARGVQRFQSGDFRSYLFVVIFSVGIVLTHFYIKEIGK
jgi:hypothetical protein